MLCWVMLIISNMKNIMMLLDLLPSLILLLKRPLILYFYIFFGDIIKPNKNSS